MATEQTQDLTDIDDDDELSAKELEHFRQRLEDERSRLKSRLTRHTSDLLAEEEGLTEEVDLANRQADRATQMKLVDKERKLLGQIEFALGKFSEGDYGICEGTGDNINRKRLELRPWTRYSVHYKEMLERQKKQIAKTRSE
jgi:DnaK suppressor protein